MPERVGPILAALQLTALLPVQVTGRDVQRGKPDPEVYLTTVGVETARRAGMRVVGMATTCHAGTLQTAGAQIVVPDFVGLAWADVVSIS